MRLDQVAGRYNYMALLKLVFFADRYHIRNYARPVSCDEYYALKLGPVPSNLKDIVDVEKWNQTLFQKIVVKAPSSKALFALGQRVNQAEFQFDRVRIAHFEIRLEQKAKLGERSRGLDDIILLTGRIFPGAGIQICITRVIKTCSSCKEFRISRISTPTRSAMA
ncbi:MAG: Panacea domain-containing protein [bacterium]